MNETAIRVEGLAKRFGSMAALDGVDFEVEAGTVFGLLGPNGAGKTTAVRILTTILKPDAGRAEVLGLDVVKNEVAVRYRIGLAGQYAAVDPNLTGQENLWLMGRLAQMPSSIIGKRADELLQRFQLDDAADRPVRTYSGGMRRRLDVAASLVSQPPVLLLDEPTTGLDLQSRGELWNMIRELVALGTTVLLTTQYLEEADRLAKQIAVIDNGKVIANDTPADLKARLGSTVIEIGFETEEAAMRAHALVAPRVDVPEREGALVRFQTDEGSRVLLDVLRMLDADGVMSNHLSVREPSLDDVFLTLTGKHVEADEPGEPEAAKRGVA